jgi:glucose-6-phosphate-specific signal transduction histidine kinase
VTEPVASSAAGRGPAWTGVLLAFGPLVVLALLTATVFDAGDKQPLLVMLLIAIGVPYALAVLIARHRAASLWRAALLGLLAAALAYAVLVGLVMVFIG